MCIFLRRIDLWDITNMICDNPMMIALFFYQKALRCKIFVTEIEGSSRTHLSDQSMTVCNEIFSGRQLRQGVKVLRRFGN